MCKISFVIWDTIMHNKMFLAWCQLLYGLMTTYNCFNGFVFNILIELHFKVSSGHAVFVVLLIGFNEALNLCHSSGNEGKYLSASEFSLS